MNGSFASGFNGSMISPRHLSCISYISTDVTGWKPRPGPCYFSQECWYQYLRGSQTQIWYFHFWFNCNQVWGLWGFYHHGKNYPPLIKIVILVQRHLGSRHIFHVTVTGMCCLIPKCTLTFSSLMLTKHSEQNKSTVLYHDHMDGNIIFIPWNIIFIP